MLDLAYMRPFTSQDITTSGTTALQTTAFGANTHVVRLCATAACRYALAATATATDTYLPANFIEYINVRPGEKIAAIQETGAGKLNITEMTS